MLVPDQAQWYQLKGMEQNLLLVVGSQAVGGSLAVVGGSLAVVEGSLAVVEGSQDRTFPLSLRSIESE